MGRVSSKVVPLDLFGGVVTNATGFAAGSRLQLATNVLPNWRSGRRLGLAPVPNADFIGSLPDAKITAAMTALPGLFNVPFIVGQDNGGSFAVWRGDFVRLTGIAPGIADAAFDLAPSVAAFDTLTPPTVYFGHRDMPYILQSDDGLTLTQYAPTNVPASAMAMIVHLQRLWIAEPITNGSTRVWFTDPLDPSTIRPEGAFRVADRVHDMFRTTPSDVSVGATSTLVLGCQSSFAAVDGDPSQGNFDFRVIDRGRGLASSNHRVETDKGGIVIATDGESYLIPPGAAQLAPIGGPIRDRLIGFRNSDAWPRGALVYDAPYVHYLLGSGADGLILDLSEAEPSWWGPIDSGVAVSAGLTVTPRSTGLPTRWISTASQVASLDGVPTTAPVLRSGYLFEPGHDVEIECVTLMVPRDGLDHTISVTVTDGNGTADPDHFTTVTQVVPAQDPSIGLAFAKLSFVFDHHPVRGAFLRITITGEVGVALAPESAVVEYRVVPRVDPQ